MDADPTDLVEVVFLTDQGRVVDNVISRKGGPPPKSVDYAGKQYLLVREEIVSGSGQETHWRVTYRPAAIPA